MRCSKSAGCWLIRYLGGTAFVAAGGPIAVQRLEVVCAAKALDRPAAPPSDALMDATTVVPAARLHRRPPVQQLGGDEDDSSAE